MLTFGVQQSGDTQLSLCHAEGLLQVLLVGLSVHLTHIDQRGSAGSNQPGRTVSGIRAIDFITADPDLI